MGMTRMEHADRLQGPCNVLRFGASPVDAASLVCDHGENAVALLELSTECCKATFSGTHQSHTMGRQNHLVVFSCTSCKPHQETRTHIVLVRT
jgi:hypothetical protein